MTTMNKITIHFQNQDDLAWFQRAIEKQLDNREQQLSGSALGLLVSSLQRATGYESTMTKEEAKEKRFGRNEAELVPELKATK